MSPFRLTRLWHRLCAPFRCHLPPLGPVCPRCDADGATVTILLPWHYCRRCAHLWRAEGSTPGQGGSP